MRFNPREIFSSRVFGFPCIVPVICTMSFFCGLVVTSLFRWDFTSKNPAAFVLRCIQGLSSPDFLQKVFFLLFGWTILSLTALCDSVLRIATHHPVKGPSARMGSFHCCPCLSDNTRLIICPYLHFPARTWPPILKLSRKSSLSDVRFLPVFFFKRPTSPPISLSKGFLCFVLIKPRYLAT